MKLNNYQNINKSKLKITQKNTEKKDQLDFIRDFMQNPNYSEHRALSVAITVFFILTTMIYLG